MQALLQQLISSLETTPQFNSSRGYSELNSVLNKYISVLNYFNSYSEEYKRATNLYYNDISSIRDNIQRSLYAPTQELKLQAFRSAYEELKSNIFALEALVQHEELAELMA